MRSVRYEAETPSDGMEWTQNLESENVREKLASLLRSEPKFNRRIIPYAMLQRLLHSSI